MHLDLDAALKPQRPFLCPELELWLVDPLSELHRAGDAEALGMPYWAFAWPGGQVLARYVLDHPELVRGKRVVDFGSGCGLEGIAAAKCGATDVLCVDIDPRAAAATLRNAALNGVTVRASTEDLIGQSLQADVILAGDVCYSPDLAARVTRWLSAERAEVFVGDPLRVSDWSASFERVATFDAPFDGDSRGLTLWKTHVLRRAQRT